MEKLDMEQVQKHINILNVAYHLDLEITENIGYEYRAICPFCGYNKNSKIATLSLNSNTNQYCCCRCGVGGYSIGLYARVKNTDTRTAYKELIDRECFSLDKAAIQISPINLLADIEIRDKVYRDFLGLLKLEFQHKRYLKNLGFLDSSIESGLYKSIPKNYIKRRLIGHELSKKHNLAGIPGLYQEEDFKWCFSRMDGFFVPVFNSNGYIQGLSIHLDKPFNGNSDIWFSSSNRINGTCAKNWIIKDNITLNSNSIIMTDNLILGNFIKEVGYPLIAFQNISNSYIILKEIEKTDIKNITFLFKRNEVSKNIEYITNRIFRDLIPLGYKLDIKYITEFKDFFDINFNVNNALNKAV